MYRHQLVIVFLAAVTAAIPLTLPLAAQCGDNSPALPVPECRDGSSGETLACTDPAAVRLWPPHFRPGLPGQQLPADRDSSDWQMLTIPGADSGHELFHSVDAVDDHLYVAYNAGLQVWHVAGAFAESPQKLFAKDGWRGDFLDFPAPGENDFLIDDLDAIEPASGVAGVLVAVAGKNGVGTSIWQHTISPSALVQRYQDVGNESRQVHVGELGGTVYAFAAGGAISVYDMTMATALATPCLDVAGTVCPGVYRGVLGGATDVAFLDLLEHDGKIFVAAGRNGGRLAEIWEIADPANPASAVRRFSGLDGGAQGVALFEHGGESYLAAVERQPDLAWEVRIYRATGCLTGAGACSLEATPWSYRPPRVGQNRFLTFSASRGTPFLYYGVQSNDLSGSRVEGLFDLSTLGGSSGVHEITDGGGTYTDDCAGNTVDYWGDYYADNGHGVRNLQPRVGRFHGDFFYRAAFGIFDVHVWSGSLFLDGFESGDLSRWGSAGRAQ